MPKSNVPFLGQVAIQTLLPNYKKMTLQFFFIWLIFTSTDLYDTTIPEAFINLNLYLGNIPLSQNIFIHSFSIKDILPNHNMFTFYLSFYVFDSPHEAFINLRMYRDLQTIFNFHCVKSSVNIDEIIYLDIETQSWLLVQCLIAYNS